VLRHSASGPGYIAVVKGEGGTWIGAGDHWATDPIAHGQNFTPDKDWHTYRLEADGNTVRFLIDGAVYATITDNKYLSGGIVGLNCRGSQIEVGAFSVLRLH